jgi:hypothetical protein
MFSKSKPMCNNLKFKDNSLRLKVNSFKHRALKLRFRASRDSRLLVWMPMN